MKICPVCQMGNSNETVMCKECGTSLGAVPAQDEEVILKTESDRYERKQRRLRNFKMSGVVLSVALHISLFAISIIRGTFFFPMLFLLLAPAAGYMMMFRAEKLFQIKIDASGDYDVNGEVRPTEWYLFKNAIQGALIMLASIILMGMIAFH